ncbi:MAG: preprotein translocase subunit YajC [Phycisphaeraceae bacterium]|nr:preprotein translocase subunit YajC [Phycisphaeraceae bacterium]
MPTDGAGEAAIETTPGQTTPDPGTDTGTGQGTRGPSLLDFLPFILIIAVFWFILMGGQRREKKKRAKMLSALAKGNKVQTVGGIIANVVEVRENEVVLKVDENANTRLRFARSAIQSVLADKEA